MGRLVSLNELDITQSSQKKKKNVLIAIFALADLSNWNFIVLYHYVGKKK
jgi:hypothetical protein